LTKILLFATAKNDRNVGLEIVVVVVVVVGLVSPHNFFSLLFCSLLLLLKKRDFTKHKFKSLK